MYHSSILDSHTQSCLFNSLLPFVAAVTMLWAWGVALSRARPGGLGELSLAINLPTTAFVSQLLRSPQTFPDRPKQPPAS